MEINIIQVGQIGLTLLRKLQQKGDRHYNRVARVVIPEFGWSYVVEVYIVLPSVVAFPFTSDGKI
jgi:choline-glycine betaine transporter